MQYFDVFDMDFEKNNISTWCHSPQADQAMLAQLRRMNAHIDHPQFGPAFTRYIDLMTLLCQLDPLQLGERYVPFTPTTPYKGKARHSFLHDVRESSLIQFKKRALHWAEYIQQHTVLSKDLYDALQKSNRELYAYLSSLQNSNRAVDAYLSSLRGKPSLFDTLRGYFKETTDYAISRGSFVIGVLHQFVSELHALELREDEDAPLVRKTTPPVRIS
jgi:hypothetical protein